MNERLYPESLIRMWLNYVVANDIRPSYEDLDSFVNEMQDYYESNGRDAVEINAHITRTWGNER
jgi:hypothetical protein